MRILVTGASGMIGSSLIEELFQNGYDVIGLDRSAKTVFCEKYKYMQTDLQDIGVLRTLFANYKKHNEKIDRVIHLAALAHTKGNVTPAYETYYHVNVECANNIFTVACENSVPVLFISTVDVYGFTKEIVNTVTPVNPVTDYAKTKADAERALKFVCKTFSNPYTIYRFSPVYTPDIKRDIQKRYYLKYPTIAYRIGKGSEYEVLSIENAVKAMVEWTKKSPGNEIKIIKDPVRMNTANCLQKERQAGRARIIIHFPRCMVQCGYMLLRKITGENRYTYLLNKALYPLKSV